MARRQRVPRHKAVTHNRNQNPKLSPYQREKKRERLANQAPTAKSLEKLDSIPRSQRRVFEYLQAKKAREAAKREALLAKEQEEAMEEAQSEEEHDNEEEVETEEEVSAHSSTHSEEDNNSNGEESDEEKEEEEEEVEEEPLPKSKKSKKSSATQYASLNEEFISSVGPALKYMSSVSSSRSGRGDGEESDRPLTVAEKIAKKKEKKHLKKQEARRVRVAEQLRGMEEELSDYVSLTGSKQKKSKKRSRHDGDDHTQALSEHEEARDKVNMNFERQLKTLRREEEEDRLYAQSAAAKRARAEGSSKKMKASALPDTEYPPAPTEGPSARRKSISFDADVEAKEAAKPPKQPRKPADFYELVDVVRYGERVEAPPVFDVVPNRFAAVSKLASKLERESGKKNSKGEAERHRLLAGSGDLGIQKRLARLGLAPAITGTVAHQGGSGSSAAAGGGSSKADEMKALRDRVMATYQKNKRKTVDDRKGVHLDHVFPKFA